MSGLFSTCARALAVACTTWLALAATDLVHPYGVLTVATTPVLVRVAAFSMLAALATAVSVALPVTLAVAVCRQRGVRAVDAPVLVASAFALASHRTGLALLEAAGAAAWFAWAAALAFVVGLSWAALAGRVSERWGAKPRIAGATLWGLVALVVVGLGTEAGFVAAPVLLVGAFAAGWIPGATQAGACGRRAMVMFAAGLSTVVALAPLAERRPVLGADLSAAAAGRPNVLVVMVDTLRADRMSLYGYGRKTTPALDRRAARRATVFDAALSPASSTVPAVKAVLSGRAASAFGLADLNAPPPAGFASLPEAFAAAGYRTGCFSANALLGAPSFRAAFATHLAVGGDYQFGRSFLLARLVAAARWRETFALAERLGVYKTSGDFVRRRMAAWIAERPAAPFFAWLQLYEPHWPYLDYGHGLANRERLEGEAPLGLRELLALSPGSPEGRALASTARASELADRYDEGVREADAVLSRVLADLEALGVAGRTLVVVVSDHGEELFEHGGYGHGHDVFEEQIHVPLVFLWPEGEDWESYPPRVATPVSTVDLGATLAELSGLPPGGLWNEKQSLLRTLEGGAAGSGVVSEAQVPGKNFVAWRHEERKVRLRMSGTATPATTPHALVFDLGIDPAERSPVRGDDPAVAPLVGAARKKAMRLWRRAASATQSSAAVDAR